jgi:dTDP-glucose 4,6-dehydratase
VVLFGGYDGAYKQDIWEWDGGATSRPGQVMRHTADFSKVKRVLGWEPQVKWEQGLERTIKWYVDHEHWWRKMLWMREIPIVTTSGKRELH